ncbi:hypothetical protein HNP90_000466 [Methanococcus maripaludis]|uniref:Uncharacterized protein n=1 Tax=Methanococcus maripaludis TaxID=39152 RepID=A0A7J9PFS7_METMI|nr:hypothetical protein [Methanococcus maripaludis]
MEIDATTQILTFYSICLLILFLYYSKSILSTDYEKKDNKELNKN